MKPDFTYARRRTNKYWTPYAWAVRVLVDRGHGVTESARTVLAKAGIEASDKNVACLRVVYYNIRKLMWPPEYAHLRGRTPPPPSEPILPAADKVEDKAVEDKAVEDFEV